MNDPLSIFPLLLCHVIGDYYLQSEKTAVEKQGNLKKTFMHCVYYCIPFLLFSFLDAFLLTRHFPAAMLLSATAAHLCIDLLKHALQKTFPLQEKQTYPDYWVYVIDQLFHLAALIAIAYHLYPSFSGYLQENLTILLFIKTALLVLLILKPTNVTFRILFARFQEPDPDLTRHSSPLTDGQKGIKGAGAVIGNLERLLTALFLGLNQYAAIGLIMTAKSITRYDKISKNPAFAEYYLIGTLYSIFVTTGLYLLLFAC